jgi:hypothetical protein
MSRTSEPSYAIRQTYGNTFLHVCLSSAFAPPKKSGFQLSASCARDSQPYKFRNSEPISSPLTRTSVCSPRHHARTSFQNT